MLERELPKAKAGTGNILRNQLDALRNQHFARENFEKQYQTSISVNEEAQKKHLSLLQEYLKTKLEYQFALKKAESIKKMGPVLQQHYLAMSDLESKRAEKEKKIQVMIPKINEKVAATDAATSDLNKGRKESVSSENSVIPGEYGRQVRDVRIITDKLFEAGLGETGELEEAVLSEEEDNDK